MPGPFSIRHVPGRPRRAHKGEGPPGGLLTHATAVLGRHALESYFLAYNATNFNSASGPQGLMT